MHGNFESEFLLEILESLRRRRKAIKYHVKSIECEKIEQIDEGERFERLEIDVWQNRHTSIRISVFDDRWIWLDSREYHNKKGWLWKWTFEGDLMPNKTGREIVEALEESLQAMFFMDESSTQNLTDIWSPFIVQKPRLVT